MIACPYMEYGCKANSMFRKDLLAHKKEYIVEHTDMSLVQISQQKEMIAELERRKDD